jgi:hypothetical protein
VPGGVRSDSGRPMKQLLRSPSAGIRVEASCGAHSRPSYRVVNPRLRNRRCSRHQSRPEPTTRPSREPILLNEASWRREGAGGVHQALADNQAVFAELLRRDQAARTTRTIALLLRTLTVELMRDDLASFTGSDALRRYSPGGRASAWVPGSSRVRQAVLVRGVDTPPAAL